MKRTHYISLVLATTLLIGTSALASPKGNKTDGPAIQTDDQQIFKVTEDSEGLQRIGSFNKMHFFGYGELHYNGKMGATANDIDFHRLVLGFGYDFTDWVNFRAELDFEHAFTEPELEYAYVDFNIKKWFNARLGAILMPLGVYNQHHEPPLFYSVERPEFYRVIIPTSWQEGGAGLYGNFENGLEYELYMVSTPTSAVISGGNIDRSFNGSNGLRGGRNGVAEADANDFGVTGRLQYKGVPGLRLGTSFFYGNTSQGKGGIGGGDLTILEADAKYSFQGIEIDSALAWTNLGDTGALNTLLLATDPTFSNFAAKNMLGWYVEGAYHVFHHLMPNTKHDLVGFVRYEDFNTQFKMPAGFAANPANDRNTLTFGLSYLPIPQVAIKADYMTNWNQANGGVDQFNLGVGFYY